MNEWVEYEPVNADLIERYKREWKQHGFPDVGVSRNARGREPGCANDPVSQPTVEQWLWVQVILETINDIRKISAYWYRHCILCHDGQPCEHVVDGKFAHGAQMNKIELCPYYHNYRDCAIRWLRTAQFSQLCDALGLDADYMRKQIFSEQGLPTRKRVGRVSQQAAISTGRPSRAGQT